MSDTVKQQLTKLIQQANQVTIKASQATFFKQECLDLKFMTENLTALLRQPVIASSDCCYHPTRWIMEEIENVLHEALSLVLKCCSNNPMNRIFTKIPVDPFPVVSSHLQNSIEDVSWLLRFSHPTTRYLSLPPIAVRMPVLCLIWEQIATLYTGSPEDRSDAAASIVALVRDSDRYRNLIAQEGGVRPLLRLLLKGNMDGQENAARAIGFLGRDPQSVEKMINFDVSSVFAKILEEGPPKVQAVVAWALSVLAKHYPKCQDHFAQCNIIMLLVAHLEIAIVRRKVSMKEMAARALWFLAKDNSSICGSIVKSRAFLCFAVLLETGSLAVQYNCAMAMTEITAVAEKDPDFREYQFNPNSGACKSVVDQMLKIIEKKDFQLLIPCVKTMGNLAWTCKAAAERRIVGPLVRVLDGVRDVEVTRQTFVALFKYVCTENDFHVDHSMEFINAGGMKTLILLVNYAVSHPLVRNGSLLLLSYVGLHVPHSEELARANVLQVLEWASQQSFMTSEEMTPEEVDAKELLLESKSRLWLFQDRSKRIS